MHSQRTDVEMYGPVKQKHGEEEARLERSFGVRLGRLLQAILGYLVNMVCDTYDRL